MRAQPHKAKQESRVLRQDLFYTPQPTSNPATPPGDLEAASDDPQIFLLKTFVCLKRRFRLFEGLQGLVPDNRGLRSLEDQRERPAL